MISLTVFSIIFVSLMLCFVFYKHFLRTTRTELKAFAQIFRNSNSNSIITEFNNSKSNNIRITVIDKDGKVIFDNTANPTSLPNHIDREEIKEAMENGFGESTRFSDTLEEVTNYYAIKLNDNAFLRLAKTSSSIFIIFIDTIPIVVFVVLIVIIFGYILAGRLTKKIMEPINNVDLNKEPSIPYDEFAPFIKTITNQRKQIEEQIADLQNRANTISTIMENMNEGIIILNNDGEILSINKSALSIFEISPSELLNGKNIIELLRDIELFENIKSTLAGNHNEMSIEHNDRNYRVIFSPVNFLNGAIILFLDVTEKTRAEKMRQEFSANVSHELKTPLTSIAGYSEMILNDMVQEKDIKNFIEKIKDESARLIYLISDIMMLSELDETSSESSKEKVEICEIVHKVKEDLFIKAKEMNVSINIFCDETHVFGNNSTLYEMFYNLVDNGIKYNHQNGTIDIRISKIDEDQVMIKISDTGIGIPKEHQSRIFERFYRVDKSRSKKSGGTGLGLSIVKHIVMNHKGRIELNSKKNEGTEIIIYLPNTAK